MRGASIAPTSRLCACDHATSTSSVDLGGAGPDVRLPNGTGPPGAGAGLASARRHLVHAHCAKPCSSFLNFKATFVLELGPVSVLLVRLEECSRGSRDRGRGASPFSCGVSRVPSN